MMNGNTIAVIGLGYVGIPIMIESARAGFNVIGLDSDLHKVSNLTSGSYVLENYSNFDFRNFLSNQKIQLTIQYSDLRDCDVVLICVPTPLDDLGKPDYSILLNVVSSLLGNLREDCLVILESTVAPGITRSLVYNKLVQQYPNIQVAYSPERIDPSNKTWNLVNTPKIISGISEDARSNAFLFYSAFVQRLVPAESVELAETSKLLENSFRLINISFINEMNFFCDEIGVNLSRVIDLAVTKPFGYMPFYPSVGVGGHCIPVDPVYLLEKSQAVNQELKMITQAVQVNKEISSKLTKKAISLIDSLVNKKVLIIGVSYKPNVSDVRETPVKGLIDLLKKEGARVDWHDEIVKVWEGAKSKPISSDYDLIIIGALHDYIELKSLPKVPIINCASLTT